MSRPPKWLTAIDEPVSTRARSGAQEKKIAKDLKGQTTVNSGATFGQNDVITKELEVEAKTTAKKSFSINIADWEKLRLKCKFTKMPVMVIDFEVEEKTLVVINYADFQYLMEILNERGKP